MEKDANKSSIWNPKRLLILFFTWNIVLTLSAAGILLYLQSYHKDNSGFVMEEKTKYILYIGTNDKDTYKQEIPTEEADRIIKEISSKYVEGYTAFRANGGWVDEKGILTQEVTLVYEYADVSEETIRAIMDELLIQLNQNAILVEREDVSMQYYYGE